MSDFCINLKEKIGRRKDFLENVEKRAFSSLCTGCTEMMGLIGAGNNPMVGMTVAIEEASK